MDKEEDRGRNKDHVTMSCKGKGKSSLHLREWLFKSVLLLFFSTRQSCFLTVEGRHIKSMLSVGRVS